MAPLPGPYSGSSTLALVSLFASVALLVVFAEKIIENLESHDPSVVGVAVAKVD